MAPAQSSAERRETRLLLVTIVVAAVALLVLAQFRFPERTTPPAEPAQAPLERLAARAAFEEMASAMADLERRIAPRLALFRVEPIRPSGGYVVAPRLTDARAAAILDAGESLRAGEGSPDVVVHDRERSLAVLTFASSADTVVSLRAGPPRPGPRYVVVVEGSAQGPTLRPVYVGRLSATEAAGSPLEVLTLEGVQSPLTRGAAVFSLEGSFLGLVARVGPVVTLYSGESLRAAAEAAQRSDPRPQGDLGIDVQDATAILLKAAGTDAGVVVAHVRPDGPAAATLRSGDVIRSIDGVEARDAGTFAMLARTREPGAPTTVQFVRRGTRQQATYRAADAAGVTMTEDLGVTGRTLPGLGIEIVAVDAKSPAGAVGLRRGDLLLTVDGSPLRNLSALTRAYRTAEPGAIVLVGLERGGQHQVIGMEKR